MKRAHLGLIGILCSMIFMAGTPVFAATSEPATGVEAEMAHMEELLLSLDGIADDNYKKYLNQYKDQIYSGDKVYFDLSDISEKERLITSDDETEFHVNAEKSGLYVLGFDYTICSDNILRTTLRLSVNGETPYSELTHLFFPDNWVTGREEYDRYGNESIAMPEKVNVESFTYLRDTAYLTNDSLMIYLTEGDNTLSFKANEGKVRVDGITLEAPGRLKEDSDAEAEGSQLIEIEAEDFITRNSPNIRTIASFDESVTPYSPTLKIQNSIDEDTYRIGGTSVDYSVTVEETGYYYVAFDYLQSTKSGHVVYRNLYVDGEIPSSSYENIPFSYTTKYALKKVEVPIYLTAGEHTLSLEVSIEPYGDAVAILNSIVEEINDMALSINKITGGNTNKYRDFDLEEYGLNIADTLNFWADTVEDVYITLSGMNVNGKKNGEIQLLETAAKSLRELSEEPNKLPQNKSTFSYGDSSVRQYLTTVSENISYGNMSLDVIYLYQKDAPIKYKDGFLKRMSLKIRHFVASFTQSDYAPGYDDDEDTIEVWVNRPRQYLEIIQRMADSDFTEKTGIKVKLSIVPDQQKLILANASGDAPDAAIGIASGYVYDLALRNALVNLRKFDNFKEVGRRFAPGMLIPAVCDDGIYAIPETFNFYVLFYRADILDKLNLEVPDNMDDVRKMIPELTRMGLGFNTHVANLTTKTFAATAPFILQNKGDIFSDGTKQVTLDTEEVIGGFKILTENFTVYDMDYEILSFYQSFRDGRTPIGVSDYASYNLLTNAAPELEGSWKIALYPGIVDENGNVDRSTSGAAESNIIFASSDKQEKAWQFIDWWMSDDVQTEFSFTLQATLGNEYMWNSANLNAIMNAPWSEEDKKIIMEQISWTNEMPRVPGSYMIEREMGNVLINVVTANENLRTAIDNAEKRINSELARKLEEFGYTDESGNTIKELVIPTKELIEEWLQ